MYLAHVFYVLFQYSPNQESDRQDSTTSNQNFDLNLSTSYTSAIYCKDNYSLEHYGYFSIRICDTVTITKNLPN